MVTKVFGETAYVLTYGGLTDAQADALVTEYAELGLRHKKCNRDGGSCLITKAPALEYELFLANLRHSWKDIKERVGHGQLYSDSNTYVPGKTTFDPGTDWDDIVTFIDANY